MNFSPHFFRRATTLLLFLLPLSCFNGKVSAQEVRDICGQYTYYAPENVTLEQARRTALQRAKLSALADEFGTRIAQNNVTRVKNENGQSDISFLSLGGSEVKGEWLTDSGTPRYDISYQDNTLIVTASVCGTARELASLQACFTASLLRGTAENPIESSDFNDGENLFLRFQSPESGYLAVYLADASGNVYCLLPYRRCKQGRFPIQANREYLLFSKTFATDDEERKLTDQYRLYTEKESEINHLYIIFSPQPFLKANDHHNRSKQLRGMELPRELSFKRFQEWLTRNKLANDGLQTEIKDITINKHSCP